MAPEHSERRRHPRYSCDIGVQVRAQQSSGGYWGTLGDISLGGCYIYTFSPLPLSTALFLTMKMDDTDVVITGIVVTFHPGVGMGIEFSGFGESDGETRLKAFITSLESKITQ